MGIVHDPWFWAFLSAFGWFLWPAVVISPRFGNQLPLGILCFVLVEVPRVVLPLVDQPRFELSSGLLVVVGGLVLLGGLVFASPVLRIVPLTRPDRAEPLRVDGLYALTRHPLMLSETLWPLGWSLMWGSIVGVLVVPIWLVIGWLGTFMEEERLVEQYGGDYRAYQARVPRLIPFLR